MNMQSKKQYLQELQKEYLGADKKQKGLLLNETEKRAGQNRKYLIDRLSAKTRWNKPKKKVIRPRQYTSDLTLPLVKLWDIFDRPCGQRLEPLIKNELVKLRQLGELNISYVQTQKLRQMSAKTIDNLLSHEKEVRYLKEKYNRKKDPLLYQKIPTKLSDEWDRNLLGQIQIDGVEHCGQTTAGEYVNTISQVDISSHWWEAEAIMGKGQRRTLGAIKKARSRYPFNWKEIHPDNGTSFINYFVYDYAKESGLAFSRSRPYKKNDNCFVEQKNSRNVRQVVGHVRYDTIPEMEILNDLYQREIRLYKNFFQPVMRLETKIRYKGHISRRYQKAKTPYQWLMESPEILVEAKQELKQIYNSLNPAELKRNIETKLNLLAQTYQTKQAKNEQKKPLRKSISVRFSNYPIGRVGLDSLAT